MEIKLSLKESFMSQSFNFYICNCTKAKEEVYVEMWQDPEDI